MIKIKKSDYELILEHAKKESPVEACGLIAGHIEGRDKFIDKVYILENIDHAEEHFTLSPKDQLNAIKDMRKNSLSPLGNWHSHPASPSRPSQEDKRLAYDSKASYLILSLLYKEPVINSFHIENMISENEGLVIE